MDRKSFLDTLKERPIIGDGSYVVTLEKRGYVRAGAYTPEAAIEYPDAVKQLHAEFQRAGADVVQAFTFYANDGKLRSAASTHTYTSQELNKAACDLARGVAKPAGSFLCGGVSPTPSYDSGHGDKEEVKRQFRAQVKIYMETEMDFLLGEFFAFTDEAEIAVQIMKESSLPVAVTLRMGPTGDHSNVSPAECAVRLARAGADIVGVNCSFDPATSLQTVRMMKQGLDQAGLGHIHLMAQPVAYHCPDVTQAKDGYHVLPEFPLAMEPRLLTRWDARRFAREAHESGVRYIGGCCGFEPYHIREMAHELAAELGKAPPGKDKHEPGAHTLNESTWPATKAKGNLEYWEGVQPSTGRPYSASLTFIKNDCLRQDVH